MADSSLKVEPGDVVLERGDDGNQSHQNYSYVHTWCKSSRVVPGHNQVVMILQSLWLFTCNSCRTSPQGDPTCNRTLSGSHRLAKPGTKCNIGLLSQKEPVLIYSSNAHEQKNNKTKNCNIINNNLLKNELTSYPAATCMKICSALFFSSTPWCLSGCHFPAAFLESGNFNILLRKLKSHL